MAKTKTEDKAIVETVMHTNGDASTALTVAPITALALPMDNADFMADAGSGLEGATAESFAIPFLSVLQKGSPQVDPDHPKGGRIDGAEAGMFFNNVNSKTYDGKAGVEIVHCAYRRVFIRWGSEASGEGFKGELTPEAVAVMRERKEVVEFENRLYFPLPDGSVNEKRCDRVSDTRNHFILFNDGTGAWTEALLSLSSTQIKKSKLLMAALANVRFDGPNGKFQPPTFANIIRATTVPESNDKGSWRGIRFVIDGVVSREIYNAGKAFHAKIVAGDVTVKYDETAAAGEAAPAAAGF